MSGCSLLIGERVVLDSPGGPPEAEYALFDGGHIELHSDGPGTIREQGYQTTAGDALERLAASGIDAALVRDARDAMKPKLVQAYARGPSVRRVASLLDAAELFEGKSYDAKMRRYAGGWLDLGALALDLKVLRAGAAMQAIHLAALLADVLPSTPVRLSTIEFTRARRPGERTYKRVPLEHAADIPGAIAALAEDLPAVQPGAGPTRSQLLQAVEGHAAALAEGEAKTRALSIARTLAVREPPPRGPLADAELWALELALSQGQTSGVLESLDAIEKARGRLPGTLYLRARAALALRAEHPRVVAERVSALSQSMTQFFELELLAAEAWMAAEDTQQAKAFARDLVDNPGAPDELRVRALELLELPSRPEIEVIEEAPDTSIDPQRIVAVQDAAPKPDPPDPTVRERVPEMLRPSTVPPRPHAPVNDPPATPRSPSYPPPPSERAPVSRTSRPPVPRPNKRRPSAPPSEEVAPIEVSRILSVNPPPGSGPAANEPIIDVENVEVIEEAPRPIAGPLPDDLPDPLGWGQGLVTGPGGSPLFAPSGSFAVAPPPFPSTPPDPAAGFAAGGSLPPFQSDAPPPLRVPRPPRLPRGAMRVELAEKLSLPPGLHGQPPPREALPKSFVDARVAFIWLSRELGKDYRTRYKIELRTDVAGIEAMQRVLRERFAGGEVLTPDDFQELKRHGAFLSEVLARGLGAEWVDIGPTELGYWAMLVPEKTRVWPFGRILRFVTMGHKERDLVSYYLELEARSRV